jgi:recombination protein RecT
MTVAALKAAATGQATPQEARDPYSQFKMQLERVKGELLPLLGNSKQNVDAFIRVILTAVSNNPDLLQADRRSLLSACTRAAQDGNMPDGREAVLNVYNTKITRGYGRDKVEEWVKKVEYIPMVAGIVKALYAHEDVLLVDAAAVYQNDKFIFRRGDDPKLEHEPTMADDAGQIVAAYLVVKLKSGEIKREVMPRRDIEKVRAASKSPDGVNSPWTKWYDQQAIKSVIKRGAKQVPRSNRFDQVEAADNESLGFASGPQALGEVFNRNAEPMALEHQPSETLDMHLDDQQDSAELVQQEEAEAKPTPKARSAEPKPVTYATLAERMNKVADAEMGALILDEGRALPADQQAELKALFEKRFPA